jgi:hypothetical protein
MANGGPCYRVDVAELAASAAVLGAATAAAEAARCQLRTALGEASGWAVDGELPSAFTRFCDTLGWAVDQIRAAADGLHGGLVTAAREYAEADVAAGRAARDALAGGGR